MDDDTLNSPNHDDIEPTERDDNIELLSDNDVDDHVSYNDEIIRTNNPSSNLVSVSLSQLSPLSKPSSSTRKSNKTPLPDKFIYECIIDNFILKIDEEGNEIIESINNIDFLSIYTQFLRKISFKLVPGSKNLNLNRIQMQQFIINDKNLKCIPNFTSSSKGRGDILHVINVLFSGIFFEHLTERVKNPDRSELMLKDPNNLTSFWNDIHTEYQKIGFSDYDDI